MFKVTLFFLGVHMKCKLKIGFFASLMVLTLAITSAEYFPALICAVALHELGHITAAKIRHIKLSEMKLSIFGASLYPRNQLFSYFDEIILCVGGPLTNLLSAAVCISLGRSHSLFSMSSIALGVLNMLPIHGFDGGRILSAFLSIYLSPKAAVIVCKMVSFVIILIMWCASVYFLLRSSATMTMFVFSMFMFSKIFISDK